MATQLRRLVTALLAASAIALVVGLAPIGATSTSNTVTYRDSTGEDPASLDISQIVVSNDDNGLLTFAISLGNVSALTGHNDVSIYIDSDNNPFDGGGLAWGGAESTIEVTDGSVNAYKWDGTTFSSTGP